MKIKEKYKDAIVVLAMFAVLIIGLPIFIGETVSFFSHISQILGAIIYIVYVMLILFGSILYYQQRKKIRKPNNKKR